MFCDQCGTENRDGAKFCKGCGSTLTETSVCSSCGAALEPGAVFCDECGTPTNAAATGATTRASSPAAQPVAERRRVSVLFVDLVGFTDYSEGRDPEDVREMLSRYFARAEEIIGLYGGTVEKFIGDAVMAVWGTPVALEDDAGRAVRAGMEMVESVAALGRSVDADLRARAGVFTGEAAVNIGAKGQGMVAGDTVNTASRLQSAASPGTVFVDRATYLAARDAIGFESAGELTLKGKDEPVEAWRATRVTAALGGFRSTDSLEPAFTGRDEEFRQIKDLLHITGRERKPRIISVVGTGGIGKSRLVWELAKYIDGLSDLIFWHQGRSPAYGEGVAFWALAEMLRMRARIAETDDEDTARTKLDECIDEYFPDKDDAEWVRPHLQQLIGLGGGNDQNREQLFAAWRSLFERIGELGPVVMVFEDLHWADPGLIDFIEHLVSWARNSPILILTLARPELVDRRPNWGAAQRNFVSIHLEPLGEDDMSLLLKSVTADLPPHVHQDIVRRAEGVPLYAVEMVRMLIDRGDLLQEEGGYSWVGKLSDIEVPDSLHSLIASRLDALPIEARLLVQDASVLGKTFTTDSLAAVTSLSAAELEPRLEDLARREILEVDTDPRSPERGQYGFVQSLIREVAYHTLSNVDRRSRHLAAARYFESLNEVDMIDVVATHYVEAHKNSKPEDPESTELADRAQQALTAAAKRASSLGSNLQALSLYESALAIVGPSDERNELLFLAGQAAHFSGEIDRSIEHLKEAIDQLNEHSHTELLARAQAQLGWTYFTGARLEDGRLVLEEAASKLDDPLSPAAALIYNQLSRVYFFLGNDEECQRYSVLAMPAAERAENMAVIADCLITRGIAGMNAGRTTECDVLVSGALKLAEKHGLVTQQLRALVNLSANEVSVNPHAAIEVGQRAVELAQRFGVADPQTRALVNMTEASIHLGRWDWMRNLIAENAESLRSQARMLSNALADLEAFAGNLEEARRHLADHISTMDPSSAMDQGVLRMVETLVAFVEGDLGKVIEVSREIDVSEYLQLETFGVFARAAIWLGDVHETRAQLELMDRSPLRNPWQRARRLTVEAAIAALEGDRDRAIELYEDALARWDSLNIPLGKALSQTDFVLTVGGPETAAAASEARAFFEEAGNQFFVRRLEEATV
ncbi:MAG: hypothetical protein QOH90_1212, partial [Actinomycetota bacterium]|nr:hypothetical protein [Actinomycetota bacterium]